VDERREEKGMVKRKTVCYLLNHHIPIHSPKGPVIAILASTPFVLIPTPLVSIPAPLVSVPATLVPTTAPQVLLTILISLCKGKGWPNT
jgi:hypothetical protein